MGEKFTSQRATQIAAGGFPVAFGIENVRAKSRAEIGQSLVTSTPTVRILVWRGQTCPRFDMTRHVASSRNRHVKSQKI
jgi:hypothetical protein